MRFSRRETRCRNGLVVSVSSHPETRLLSEHFTKSFRIPRYAFFVCKPWWSILRGDTIWARWRPELKARHAKRVRGHDFPENSENSSIFYQLKETTLFATLKISLSKSLFFERWVAGLIKLILYSAVESIQLCWNKILP